MGKRRHEVKPADIQASIANRQAGPEGKKNGASNGTINRELSMLKRAFNLGLADELIFRKPKIPHLAEHNVRPGFFERADFETLLAHLPDYLRPPLTFAYNTGWRILSEVLPLTWDRVDLVEGTVRLDVGTTKNKEGRDIYLPAELRGVLAVQWAEHQAAYPECPLVFHHNGKRIFSFYKAWYQACAAASVAGHKVPHDFRRSAVRNMVRAGIPERVAMQISGHKTRAIFDRYHIVSDGDLREAARRLESISNGVTTTISTTRDARQEENPRVTH